MAESTLVLTYTDLLNEVCLYLGWGATAANRTAADQARIDTCVQAAYRTFLFPDPLPGETTVHVWSFLSPVTTLAVTSVAVDYDAPDNFGGLVGDMTVSGTDGYVPIRHVGEGQIRAWRASASTSGRPQAVAVRPKASTPDALEGQRWEFLIWPTPDGSYTLNYRQNVIVNKLSATAPYPLGSATCGQTLLALCLGEAEERENDERGVRWARGQERLRASILRDRATQTPATLGYCGDGPNGTGPHVRSLYSTVNGVLPTA